MNLYKILCDTELFYCSFNLISKYNSFYNNNSENTVFNQQLMISFVFQWMPSGCQFFQYCLGYCVLAHSGLILFQTGNWQWKFKENSINIYYEKHERESPDPSKNILMIPTISDVSTVEEWRLVAQDIVQRVGKVNWRATIVDWPGLGYSDRPKMDYNADVMEKFVVDLINAPDSPVSSSGC